MKRYFRMRGESDLGGGVVYMEFEDNWPKRQAEVYSGRWFRSTRAYHPEIGPGLGDQPLSELPEADPITREEFEEAWRQAGLACP